MFEELRYLWGSSDSRRIAPDGPVSLVRAFEREPKRTQRQNALKTIGLIGGIGPESTIDYYRQIVDAYRRLDDGRSPALVITSMDVREILTLVEARDVAALADGLIVEVERLARAGAAFAAIAANTPHVAFDCVQRRAPIPLVSIVESTRDVAIERGYNKLGLLGTRFTMQEAFYEDVFGASGLALVVPTDEEMRFIHHTYVSELLKGTFAPAARDRVASIVERLGREAGVDAVILAGTELPLLLRSSADISVPVLDTTEIHVARIVAAALCREGR